MRWSSDGRHAIFGEKTPELILRQRAALAHLRKLGRPVGTRRLAAQLGVALRTFKLAVEPELIRLGLVSMTPRGMVATA